VALRKEETLLGFISMYRQEVRPFSDKQIALLQNFAAQAVIAMENARLLTETREALEQQTATAEVLQVINSSPGDLAPVFDAILENAHHLCDIESGALLLHEGEKFRAVATRGYPEEVDQSLRQPYALGPNSPVQALLNGEPLAEIPDVIAHQAEAPNPRAEAAIAHGMRSVVFVPLRRDSLLLGMISAARKEAGPFLAKEIGLLQNFAAQAVIAMENARLLTETREALEQQTATAEVLQVINSSPGDLAPVFDAMLERATRLCEASSGLMWTTVGERFQAVATRGMSTEFVEFLRDPDNQPRMVASNLPIGRVVRGEPLVHVLNLMADEFTHEPPALRKLVELGGFRTILALPLRNDSALLGAFVVGRREVRPFTAKQIALLQNFAAQAVIAMENARLLTETREALEQQTATAEVLQVINSSPGDLAPVFDAILDKAHTLCGAEHGALTTFDGEMFRAAATRGLPEPFAELLRGGFRPLPGSAPEPLLRGERCVHIVDMAALVAESTPAAARLLQLSVDLAGTRTLLLVPLRKDGALLGYIAGYRQEVRPFSDKQIELLQNFAAQAVIAMQNARLMNETREALEQQTATAEVLGVINSSPGGLAPVFDAILEKAHALCGAEIGSLTIYDGEENRAVATRGLVPSLADRLRQGFRPDPAHPIRKLLSGARVVQVPDVGESADPIARASFEQGGIRTSLYVPLRKDDRLLGLIVASRQEVRLFSDKEITLLENFAAQAVIAMENARLLGELRQRTDEVAELNRGLEARVAEQVDELARVGRLKRFLAPQLAELIVSHRDEKILESHRREIVVVFCDLRGYTAFTETAEPEEVLDFLREYHGALGPLVSQFEGTLDQFSGDRIMVFFNDPVPIPDPAERAVRMAIAMREAAGALIADWRRRDRELGFGAGIAQGYATLGQIGFAERSGYTAIGTVCNLAARLCAEAKNGQILIAGRVAAAVEKVIAVEDLGSLTLKGLAQPVSAFNVPLATTSPTLRVIEGGPQSV